MDKSLKKTIYLWSLYFYLTYGVSAIVVLVDSNSPFSLFLVITFLATILTRFFPTYIICLLLCLF